jgi:hypothetical protein
MAPPTRRERTSMPASHDERIVEHAQRDPSWRGFDIFESAIDDAFGDGLLPSSMTLS